MFDMLIFLMIVCAVTKNIGIFLIDNDTVS